jgi:hypothetical protein
MEYGFSGVVTLEKYVQFNKMFHKKVTFYADTGEYMGGFLSFY